jgi:type IV secretion system protein VirB9
VRLKLSRSFVRLICGWLAGCAVFVVSAQPSDPRIKEHWYDPNTVVTVLVKRGVVTQIALDEHESITEVGSGLGAECAKVDASWCIAAQAGGRNIFVKPKTTAGTANNLAVVTDKRSHAFRLIVLPEGDARSPIYRLSVKAPVQRIALPARSQQDLHSTPQLTPPPGQQVEKLIAERMQVMPQVVNSAYSIAEGQGSSDIIPSLVFDDGLFTYFRFPSNGEVPAVFHVLGDGSETLINTRMEGDLLVGDRVSRRLMLRSGSAVVGVWNEAFDIDGARSKAGTTVSGIERVLKFESGSAPDRHSRRDKP